MLSRSQRGSVSAASSVAVVIPAWILPPPLRELPLHIGELLGDLAVLYPKDIDAADGAVAPGIAPANRTAVTGGEGVLGREMRPRRSGEERLPEGADCRLPLMPLAVGWRRRVLEDDIVGHQRHHRIDVVPVEGIVEA